MGSTHDSGLRGNTERVEGESTEREEGKHSGFEEGDTFHFSK